MKGKINQKLTCIAMSRARGLEGKEAIMLSSLIMKTQKRMNLLNFDNCGGELNIMFHDCAKKTKQ